MSSIKITRLHNDYDCEDCGYSDAYGATVTLDGKVIVDLKPVAHCLGGKDYSDEDILKEILTTLGYDVEIEET